MSNDKRSLARDFSFRFLYYIDQSSNSFDLELISTEEEFQKVLLEFSDVMYTDDKEVSATSWESVDQVLAKSLINCFFKNYKQFDELISPLLSSKNFQKLKPVDKLLIQLGFCESKLLKQTPLKVCLNEYINLAKTYGTTESSHLINAVLDQANK